MIDISTLDPDLTHSRGVYATVRGAHEDEKNMMAKLCGEVMSLSSGILKAVQPADEDECGDTDEMLTLLDGKLIAIRYTAEKIKSLALQRAEWKNKAWPKPTKGKKENERATTQQAVQDAGNAGSHESKDQP